MTLPSVEKKLATLFDSDIDHFSFEVRLLLVSLRPYWFLKSHPTYLRYMLETALGDPWNTLRKQLKIK